MNSSLIKKVSSITLAAFVLLGVVGGSAWWQFARVAANQEELGMITAALRHQLEADMMHDALRSDVLAALHAAAVKDVAAANEVAKELAAHARHFRAEVAANRALPLPAKPVAALGEVGASLESYILAAEQIVALSAKDPAAAERTLPTFVLSFSQLEGKMSAVSDVIEEAYQSVAAASGALQREFHKVLAIALSVGALALIALSIYVAGSIPRPFRKIVDVLCRTSAANAATSARLIEVSASLASGSSEQAASLEETSASLEEMSSLTRRTAASAQTAKDLGNQTRSAAEIGEGDMQAMSRAMDDIQEASNNIAKIIKTIDEIAFQTNLLALNAAVEAARAGDAGAGFAVVADEVRNLAQRSAVAARETANKIEDSIRKSQRGVQLSSKVAQGLHEIVGKARQVDELIGEIAVAANEQSQGIAEINSAVLQLNHVTQETSASSAEMATAAEELHEQSDSLEVGISGLRKLVGGAAPANQPAPTPTPIFHSAQQPTHRTASHGPQPAARPNGKTAPALQLTGEGRFSDF